MRQVRTPHIKEFVSYIRNNSAAAEQPVQKAYEKITRHWEAGLPLERRWRIFLAADAAALALSLVGAWLDDSLFLFLGPWLFGTILLAFVLGTFHRLDFSQGETGKLHLTRSWRLCFFAQSP